MNAGTVNSIPTETREEELDSNSSAALDPTFIPLSFAQQRLWFLDQLEPNTSLYNIPTVVRISGQLDVKSLERALNGMVTRHEILRTRIACQEDIPGQMISQAETIDLR